MKVEVLVMHNVHQGMDMKRAIILLGYTNTSSRVSLPSDACRSQVGLCPIVNMAGV